MNLTSFNLSFAKVKRLRNSSFWFVRFIYLFFFKLWVYIRCIFILRYRSEIITKFTQKKDLHQLSTYTELDRYPDLFEIAKVQFKDVTQLKILSFGCSTGEEVLSLRQLFPIATIIGVDINKWCIRQCKNKINENNINFYQRFDKEFEADLGYDMILCMAVLQRTANRFNTDNRISVYPFSQFENEIIFLDKKLKKGGLLFIDHADFSFSDTSCYYKYMPQPSENNMIIRERPQYNRQNHKISDEQNNYRAFIKLYN
jgi:hypothetical protein